MANKRPKPEEIVTKLRQVEVLIGQGVSLFASWAVRPELESGALVNPFGITFPTSFAYHLIVPLNKEMSPSVRNFHDWLLKISEIWRQNMTKDVCSTIRTNLKFSPHSAPSQQAAGATRRGQRSGSA